MGRTGLAVGLVALALFAGCVPQGGGGGGSERVVASGTPATVADGALSSTGYAAGGATNRTFNTTVTLEIHGDVQLRGSRDVTATVPIRRYHRNETGGVVAVASTPAVQPVEGQPFYRDPLATKSPAEQANFLQSTYQVSGLEQVDNATVSVLGNETGLHTYSGTADGTDVRVYLMRVQHGGDFVTVLAVAPADAGAGDRVRRLLDGLEHPKE